MDLYWISRVILWWMLIGISGGKHYPRRTPERESLYMEICLALGSPNTVSQVSYLVKAAAVAHLILLSFLVCMAY